MSSCKRYLNAGHGLLLRFNISRNGKQKLSGCAEIFKNLQVREGWNADMQGAANS